MVILSYYVSIAYRCDGPYDRLSLVYCHPNFHITFLLHRDVMMVLMMIVRLSFHCLPAGAVGESAGAGAGAAECSGAGEGAQRPAQAESSSSSRCHHQSPPQQRSLARRGLTNRPLPGRGGLQSGEDTGSLCSDLWSDMNGHEGLCLRCSFIKLRSYVIYSLGDLQQRLRGYVNKLDASCCNLPR